jgi:low affinity Fe/Cu permease
MENNSENYKISKFSKAFDKIASTITRATGRPISSILAVTIILIWLVTGPIFHYSDTWQLVINTGTTVITFIMVFIIQQSANKDTTAIQLKLNELIACEKKASNRLIAVEDLTEDELIVLKRFYSKLSLLSHEEKNLHTSHSIDEAIDNHKTKVEHLKK